MLRFVRDTLTKAGYAPVVTGAPDDLAALIRAERPQLVLLDLVLSGRDGIELLQEVPELSDLPVIFISGYGRDETVARAFELGADDYIVKPFSPTELVARIRAALRRRREPEAFVLGELAIEYERPPGHGGRRGGGAHRHGVRAAASAVGQRRTGRALRHAAAPDLGRARRRGREPGADLRADPARQARRRRGEPDLDIQPARRRLPHAETRRTLSRRLRPVPGAAGGCARSPLGRGPMPAERAGKCPRAAGGHRLRGGRRQGVRALPEALETAHARRQPELLQEPYPAVVQGTAMRTVRAMTGAEDWVTGASGPHAPTEFAWAGRRPTASGRVLGVGPRGPVEVAMGRSPASVFLCAFWALSAGSGAGGAAAGDGGTEIAAGYASRAGAVLGKYRPPPDRSPETMARAAARFLASLDKAQRRSEGHDLASPERRRWTNAPVRGQAGGVAPGDLDDVQFRAFSDLLAALLSAKGYGKVRDIMLGDDLRATVDGEPNEGVGIEAFRFSVFGDPSAASRWAVQLDGHHVALNITLEGEAYSLSPSFLVTYPQAFTVAGAEVRPLGAETDLAHELAGSLTPAQRTLAVIGERRGALRVGPGRDGVVPEPVGIPGRLLDGTQREKLPALASQWFDLMPPAHARAHQERYLDGLAETRFAWSGPLAAGSDVSWPVQGPSVVIEYANAARAAPMPTIPWITCTRSTGIRTATMAAGSATVPAGRRNENRPMLRARSRRAWPSSPRCALRRPGARARAGDWPLAMGKAPRRISGRIAEGHPHPRLNIVQFERIGPGSPPGAYALSDGRLLGRYVLTPHLMLTRWPYSIISR